ncbi:MAG: extracellular solute-binding protein [Verrucomicrobia bacterium]|nr:extracellular solute-binding protein [Verrucomicrobiota bacterium]
MSASSAVEETPPEGDPGPQGQPGTETPAPQAAPPSPPILSGARLEWIRLGVVFASLGSVISLPFLLRPPENQLFTEASESLVILSPHPDNIRTEFALAFARHMKARTGKPVRIDWRDAGGTSEISKLLDSSYQAAFENAWHSVPGRRWTEQETPSPGLAAVSKDRPDSTPEDDTPSEAARREFLASQTGIGVDLFFGGGTYPFVQHARRGHLVDSGIFEAEKDWFREEVIPATASGETLYDPEHRWVGNCLSSFGICYNTDWIRRLGVPPPAAWADLGDPRFQGKLAIADPTKSGSAVKTFEMLMQQQLGEAVARIDPGAVADPELAARDALDAGWTAGLNLIQKISANARYFTDSSAKTPFDVAQGNAAAGMSIDFYGRTLNETLRRADGSSRLQFILPEGGTSIGADPIAMLRGAPHPELALEFIRFVLSPEGQRLWHYRAGVPGGPARHALRRFPIRKDAYTASEMEWSSDPDGNPYERSKNFHYHEEWTGAHLGVLQFIIQAMCLEPHEELCEAWKALAASGFPPRASRLFFDVQFVGYTNVTGGLSEQIRGGDLLMIQKRRRDLRENFRRNYVRAAELARKGE